MVLCAGLGTRLRPLTSELPKPLIPLFGRPLASYALTQLQQIGVTNVVANTFHLGSMIEPGLRPYCESLGIQLECVSEPVLLGTGGGIHNALSKLGMEPFVVFNGDIFATPDLQRALAMHRASNARMTMVLREDPNAEKLGSIEVDADGRVRRMLGEGPESAVPTRRCMFTGIYVLSPDVVADLPENGCIIRHTLRRWLARGERVSAIIDEHPWYDLGTIDAYADVVFRALDGRLKVEGFACDGSTRWVHPSATIEGADLGDYVAVEAGARITGQGSVRRSIAWKNSVVAAPASDLIVSSQGARVAITSSGA